MAAISGPAPRILIARFSSRGHGTTAASQRRAFESAGLPYVNPHGFRTTLAQLGQTILERPVSEKILTYLGLDPQPPPRGRAREAGQDLAA
jgi:integrase